MPLDKHAKEMKIFKHKMCKDTKPIPVESLTCYTLCSAQPTVPELDGNSSGQSPCFPEHRVWWGHRQLTNKQIHTWTVQSWSDGSSDGERMLPYTGRCLADLGITGSERGRCAEVSGKNVPANKWQVQKSHDGSLPGASRPR